LSLVRGGQRASSGDGLNDARDGDFAHPPVSQVSDVEIASGVEREPIGLIELSGSGWSAVSSEARHARSGERMDASSGRDYAYTIGGGVGDIDVSRTVDSDSLGLTQCSRKSRASVAPIVTAGHGLDAVGSGKTRYP
jgi:hypothetical protein